MPIVNLRAYCFGKTLYQSPGKHIYIANAKGVDVPHTIVVKSIHIPKSSLSYQGLNEFEIMLGTRHVNIASLLGWAWDPHCQVMHMGLMFADAGDLDGYLTLRKSSNRRISDPSAFRLSQQIWLGLSYLHRHGIVHRDIKPSNIMLHRTLHASCKREYGKFIAKIGDFGEAIFFHPSHEFGSPKGTPAYWSPEQFTGVPPDSKSDVWAAGLVTHQILTLRYPFNVDYMRGPEWRAEHEKFRKLLKTKTAGTNLHRVMLSIVYKALRPGSSDRITARETCGIFKQIATQIKMKETE